MGELRILVVDDNEASAKTIGWTIELLGYKVELAYDGPSALKAVEGFSPNLVLLDIGLPGMNGYELCEKMRELPDLKNTVFIAQTGWSEPEHMKRSSEAGFNYHWVKPLEFAKIGPMIADIAREHKLT